MSSYEQGIEAAARAEYEQVAPTKRTWDTEQDVLKDAFRGTARLGVEAFLAVQPTLRWCLAHEGFAFDGPGAFGREQCLKASPGLDDDPPCRIVEQRRTPQ